MTDGAGDDAGTNGGAPAVRGLRLWTWAAVAVVGIDVVFFSGASNFLASPQARILNQLLMLGAALALAVAARRGVVDLRSPLVLPGLALAVATLIATLASERLATSLEALALMFMAGPMYLVVRGITWAPWLRSRLDRLIVASTVVFVVAYLLQAGVQWVRWWSVAGLSIPPLRPGDVGLTIGTVNAVALYLEALVPLAAALAWTSLRRPILGIVIAVLGVGALVVTGSRGAWLGAAGATLVTGVLAWLLAGRPLPRVASRRGRAALVVVGLLAIGATLVLAPVLSVRLVAGDAGRFELWSAAWSMFTSSPITGTGPGTFPLLRPLTPISDASYVVLTTSHNSVLQTLTDSGLLGLAASAWVVATLAWLGLRAMGGRRATAEATVAVAVVGSLLAILIHSIVDTQFHIPGVVALVFLLAARLDRPGEAVPGRIVPRRSLAAAGIVMLLVGVVILAPVDGAMVLAAQANAALNAGDAPSALGLFRTAVGLHELAPYRLGEGVAASYAGDPAEAQASFERAAALYPATFVRANLAATAEATARDAILSEIEAEDPYDPAAMANAAVLRYPSDVPQAIDDLADAMTGVPTLVYSKRPPELFDDETWAAAQAMAVDRIGAGDPVTAAAVAAIAGFKDLAARQSANVRDPRAREALDLLATAVQGGADGVERGRVLLREDPGSQVLERALWLIAFQAKSQVLVDEVATASLTLYFTVPDPPMELVLDGQLDADWAWRMPRWPMASDFRNGPDRQYAAGMVTIEPVYRPKDDRVAAAAALGVSVPTAR